MKQGHPGVRGCDNPGKRSAALFDFQGPARRVSIGHQKETLSKRSGRVLVLATVSHRWVCDLPHRMKVHFNVLNVLQVSLGQLCKPLSGRRESMTGVLGVSGESSG